MKFDVDGASAYAYTGGKRFDATLPRIVFIHGAQHDHSVWALQSRYLANHGYAVLALDLPGHGRSAGPLRTSVPAMAAWVAKAVEAAGGPRAGGASGNETGGADPRQPAPTVLVGHSMGSLIALEASAGAPRWLAGIALVATACPMRVSDALLEAAANDEARAFDMINYWSNSGITHLPGSPGPGFSTFNQNRRLMERQSPGVLLNDFRACNDYGEGLERARALGLPALIVQAQADLMTPPKASRPLVDAIAGVTVEAIAGAGHNVMAERPDDVLLALKRWLPKAFSAR